MDSVHFETILYCVNGNNFFSCYNHFTRILVSLLLGKNAKSNTEEYFCKRPFFEK